MFQPGYMAGVTAHGLPPASTRGYASPYNVTQGFDFSRTGGQFRRRYAANQANPVGLRQQAGLEDWYARSGQPSGAQQQWQTRRSVDDIIASRQAGYSSVDAWQAARDAREAEDIKAQVEAQRRANMSAYYAKPLGGYASLAGDEPGVTQQMTPSKYLDYKIENEIRAAAGQPTKPRLGWRGTTLTPEQTADRNTRYANDLIQRGLIDTSHEDYANMLGGRNLSEISPTEALRIARATNPDYDERVESNLAYRESQRPRLMPREYRDWMVRSNAYARGAARRRRLGYRSGMNPTQAMYASAFSNQMRLADANRRAQPFRNLPL